MKRISVIVFFMMLVLPALSQQVFFLYIQTENRQPFYVRINDKVFSSAASGYLVIPKLSNGEYILSVGFPKNEWPAQTIPVSISNHDLGFTLKNFGDKGWGLFNLQTMAVLMASTTSVKAQETVTSTDEFSNTLANVVNTPSIKEKPKADPVVPESKPNADSAMLVQKAAAEKLTQQEPEIKKDTVVAQKKDPPVEKNILVKAEPLTEPTQQISRIERFNDADGVTCIYVLENGQDKKDTVRIFIPLMAVSSVPVNTGSIPEEIKKEAPEVPAEKQTADQNQPEKFLSIELPNPNQPQSEKAEIPADSNRLNFNSDCRALASNEDFLKARRKMVSESNDAGMIAEARKLFRQKCYSADQIKNLSALFLTDEGKYAFFEAVYPFVFDPRNFSKLSSELSSDTYISRFKTLVRQ